jgi:hypothetical protein
MLVRLYRNSNGIYEILVIDPKEWDWWYVYGSDRPPGPIGTVFEARDKEGHLQLVKISEFGEWKISEFGEGLAAAMSPEAQALPAETEMQSVSCAPPPLPAGITRQSSPIEANERGAPNTNEQRTTIAEQVVDEVAQRQKNQNGLVPNVKKHTTEAMGLLAERYPRNHATRSEVEKMAKTPVYAKDRCQPGERTERALKRFETDHRSL